MSVDGERLRSASRLASILPVQILDHDSINIVFGEPALRRRFLDWGVFHVEPRFAPLIQSWRQVLAHRNAVIKEARNRRGVGDADIAAWTKSYAAMSVSIAEMRHAYLRELIDFLNDSDASPSSCGSASADAAELESRYQQASAVTSRGDDISSRPSDPIESQNTHDTEIVNGDNRSTAFGHLNLAGFPNRSIKITLKHGFAFEPGAPTDSNIRLFIEELDSRKEAELALGRTLSGPGRCDVILRDSNVAIREHLSRGQGKLLAAQLLLGQMAHLEIVRKQTPGVILIDDLYSELDYSRADAVIEHATAGGAQVFVSVLASSVDDVPDSLRALSHGSMFHVEHTGVTTCTQSSVD